MWDLCNRKCVERLAIIIRMIYNVSTLSLTTYKYANTKGKDSSSGSDHFHCFLLSNDDSILGTYCKCFSCRLQERVL